MKSSRAALRKVKREYMLIGRNTIEDVPCHGWPMHRNVRIAKEDRTFRFFERVVPRVLISEHICQEVHPNLCKYPSEI